MPASSEESAPKEFLVVTLPDDAKPGATLRLLNAHGTLGAAEKAVASLDPGILGRVAVLERKSLYVRRPAVESSALSEPIVKS